MDIRLFVAYTEQKKKALKLLKACPSFRKPQIIYRKLRTKTGRTLKQAKRLSKQNFVSTITLVFNEIKHHAQKRSFLLRTQPTATYISASISLENTNATARNRIAKCFWRSLHFTASGRSPSTRTTRIRPLRFTSENRESYKTLLFFEITRTKRSRTTNKTFSRRSLLRRSAWKQYLKILYRRTWSLLQSA